MNKFLLFAYASFLMVTLTASRAYSQCAGESYSIVNQCPNQTPQLSITPVLSGTNYKWYVGGSQFGAGHDFTYQTPLTGPTIITYQKEVNVTGGPAAGAAVPYTMPAGATTVLTSGYTVDVNSTTDFQLNSITVPVKLYFCDPNATYRLKVIVGPVATPTDASIWYTFKCADMISTSEGQTYLVKMPVNTSTTVPGLNIPAGPTSVSVIYDDAATNPPGTSALSGLVAFPTTAFNNTYTIGTTTVSHSTSVSRPAFLDWDLTTLCDAVDIPVSPVASASCCVPANVTAPNISSSTGTNIIDSDPVAPAVTLSTALQAGYYYQWYKNGVSLAAAAQNGNTLNVTTSGQYSVRVVEKLADIGKTACYKSDVELISKRVLFALTNDNTLCLGDAADLNALGATGTDPGDIVWSGASGISDVNSKTPIFLPTSAGTYILEVDAEVPVGNQVINGDFELFTVGDASPGFTHSPYYNFVDPATAVPGTAPATYFGIPNRYGVTWLQNGNFSIYNYVLSNNDGYTGIKPCQDHTTGSGNLLFTDAASKNVAANVPLTESYIWSQQVSLEAGQTYEFAAWFTNANTEYCECTDPFDGSVNAPKTPSGQPMVNLYVNDILVNPTPITIAGATCEWQKVSYQYVAPASGTATIKIVEISRADAGNDFAIDDISFGSPGRQKSTVTIDVTDCDDYNATAVCTAGTVELEATSTNGFFSKWTHTTTDALTNSNTLTDPLASSTTATPVVTTDYYTAEFKFVRGNQVSNPDYSGSSANGTTLTDRSNQAGNYGLTSEYIIGKDPSAYSNTQDKIYVAVPDHTTGSAASYDYYAASGNYTAGKNVVFSQTLTMTSGEEYGFSVWLANIHQEFTKAAPDTTEGSPYGTGAKTTKLDLYVGGVWIKRLVLPLNTDWTNFGYEFTAISTGNTTIELRIPNITSNKPSAFAMDDIMLGKVDTKTMDIPLPPSCVLPVTFLYFNLENMEGAVKLNWGTADERNADLFMVEHSSNGVDFTSVGIVPANGDGAGPFHYHYPHLTFENTYYRIRQVDKDGAVLYSTILFSGIRNTQLEGISVQPNPSSETFLMQVSTYAPDEVMKVRIIDVRGSLFAEFMHQGRGTFETGADLKPGVYFVEVFGSQQVWRKKIIKH